MEAKDTVMSDEQMFRVLEHEANSGLMALLKSQAEISYKAGMREVVESPIIQKFLWFADNVPCVSEMLGDADERCECATCLAKRMQAILNKLKKGTKEDKAEYPEELIEKAGRLGVSPEYLARHRKLKEGAE